MIIKDIPTNILVWDAVTPAIIFAALAQFLFVYNAYRPNRKIPKRIILLLFVVPLITAVIALSPMAGLIREAEVIQVWPVREVNYAYQEWFWVYAAYSYLLAIFTIWIIIKGHLSKPKFYRLPSTLIAIGVAVMLLGNIFALMGFTPVALDPTAIAAAITLIFLRLSLTVKDHSLFARYARSRVFSYMEDYVLVLGKGGHVSDFNPSANRWFSSVGIDLRTTTLEGALDTLREKGATVIKSPEGEEGRDIFLMDGGFPLVLNLRTHDVVDEKGYRHGFVSFFSNVTQNRMFLDKLEKRAKMDYLTGLPNRIAFEGAKKRYDAPEHLPLSVIMCDLNGLKETNDGLGHKCGDLMLQTASEVLDNAREKQDFVARIGGDEFIFLLSRRDAKAAEDFINRIKHTVSTYTQLPFKLSIAMGAATKLSKEESLDDIISLADNLMYQDKKQMKEKGI
jgi:diguanylate cyclase (GGDEF)-like protein